MSVRCFLIEPTGALYPQVIVMEVGHDHHHVTRVTLDRIADGQPDDHMPSLADDNLPWPTACERCGHGFTPMASRSASVQREWERPDTGERHPRPHDFGPGAMWDATWMPDSVKRDGHYLAVILPDGFEWHADGPAADGGYWTRTGTPPNITAHPSIKTPTWHGFLRDGVLS